MHALCSKNCGKLSLPTDRVHCKILSYLYKLNTASIKSLDKLYQNDWVQKLYHFIKVTEQISSTFTTVIGSWYFLI